MGLPALALHGWSWTQDGFFELTGIIREVYVGNPHATLDVDVEGEIWRVELAPPSATIRAGFTEKIGEGGRRGGCHRQPLARRDREADEGGAHHRQRQDIRCLSGPRAAGVIVELLAALEQSAAARLLKGSFYIYPVVNAVHIAAIGVLFTSVWLMDLRVLGCFRAIRRNHSCLCCGVRRSAHSGLRC